MGGSMARDCVDESFVITLQMIVTQSCLINLLTVSVKPSKPCKVLLYPALYPSMIIVSYVLSLTFVNCCNTDLHHPGL